MAVAKARAWVGIAGVAVGLLGLGATWSWRRVHTAESLETTTTRGPGWEVGERRSYRVELQSRVLSGEQDLLRVEVSGTLGIVAVSAADRRFVAKLDVERATVTNSPEESDEIGRALGEEFGFVLASSLGLVESVGFAETRAPIASQAVARGLLRTILTGLQVAAPPDQASKEWTAQERDAVGLVTTQYRRLSPLSISKTKGSYLRVTSADPLIDARTDLTSSTGELTFTSDPYAVPSLRSARIREATRVSSEGPFPQLSSELDLRIDFASTRKESPDALKRLATLAGSFRQAALDDRSAESQIKIDHGKLKGTNFRDLLTALADLPNGDAAKRAKLFSLLKTHLRFEEDSAREAERLIRTGSSQKDILIDALASAGSAFAQGVLQRVVDSGDFADEDRRRALIGLSFVERPSEETLGFLEGLGSDPIYGTQALYGLGTAAYNLQGSSPQVAENVTTKLTRSLDASSDANDRVRLLKAVGNAGNPSALDEIEEKLRDPDPLVRAAAVWALRRIPGDRAEQGIALTLRQDATPDVRLRALDALAYRSAAPVLVYALRDGLLNEKEVVVRREIVRAGMRWAKVAPVLSPPLTQLSTSDPDQKIRELLKNWKG